jgi:L-alanine-DL-glutamate epimerase-like enolase superfamily enzyme
MAAWGNLGWWGGVGVQLLEQPLPASDCAGLRRVTEASPLPVIADESVRTAEDVVRLRGCVHGINIKLSKCGGLREALRMIHVARAQGMRIMLGCFIESSLGITAAAHLAPLVDYVDLDGHLLIRGDPFSGVRVSGGRLVLPDRHGLGVERAPVR